MKGGAANHAPFALYKMVSVFLRPKVSIIRVTSSSTHARQIDRGRHNDWNVMSPRDNLKVMGNSVDIRDNADFLFLFWINVRTIS